jgi:Fe-S-cluster containining protein
MNALKPLIKRAKPLYRELQVIYRNLPETECRCDQPGVCCAFLPEMTGIEALHWFSIILEKPQHKKTKIIRKFVQFYFTNPIRHTGCPFLAKGSCSIYEFRTFACRAYGLWSRDTGEIRTRQSRQDRRKLIQMWERFGVCLPKEMVESEIDYCDKVSGLAEEPLSDGQLMAYLQQVYGLDQLLPELKQSFEEEYHSDFSFLVASLVFGQRKAILGKYAVIKDIVQKGRDERLNMMLEKVSPAIMDQFTVT